MKTKRTKGEINIFLAANGAFDKAILVAQRTSNEAFIVVFVVAIVSEHFATSTTVGTNSESHVGAASARRITRVSWCSF